MLKTNQQWLPAKDQTRGLNKVHSFLGLCFFYQTVTTNIISNAACVDGLCEQYCQCEQYSISNLSKKKKENWL